MNLSNTESLAKRRAVILATIIPYTIHVAFMSLFHGIKGLWLGAAEQWRRRA